VIFGVSNLSDKMLSMASSSACRMAYIYKNLSIDRFRKAIFFTLHNSFVLFLAFAIRFSSFTNTQPTGTSPAANASSA
jgi:hypothetical protein